MYIFVSFFRWIVNKKASDTLIEVWDDVQKMVAFWEGPLFIAKLQFFSFVSNIVGPFLKKFQADQPMISFLYGDLSVIVMKLLDIIVEHKIIKKCKNEKKLMGIDLAKN